MIPRNPFDSIYVSEEVDPDTFVDLFSPLLVHDTLALFEPGNVILMGTQGSGKSMLLNLLKPETQVAYARTGTSFPLEGLVAPFIGCGVNLLRCGAMDFGQRELPAQGSEGPAAVTAYFADFLNYWITRDLLESLDTLGAAGATRNKLGIAHDRASLDRFATELASDACWAGGLARVKDYASLGDALAARIQAYRSFLNFNSEALDPRIVATKTSAGEPVAIAAELIRRTHLVNARVEVFVRIDQYEDLGRLEHRAAVMSDADDNFYDGFTSAVHKMLGLRDPRVSYRIGTRRHAWPEDARMQGTSAVLERLRNYKLLDLDQVLRRGEHSPDQFRPFAEDVFLRRLTHAGYAANGNGRAAMRQLLGAPLRPDELAHRYAPSGAADVLDDTLELPNDARSRLRQLAREDPLDGLLAEAWFHQQVKAEKSLEVDWTAPPWRTKEYWRKERQGQALLQLAARKRQRMIWCGDKTVRDLAGSNILAFVSLCQSIFDAWLRTLPVTEHEPAPDGWGAEARRVPSVGLPNLGDRGKLYLQDQGIREASDFWYSKIESDPDGSSRQRFVDALGKMFREKLRSDVRMSYPGHNGFSVEIADLRTEPLVREVLNECAAFGVLYDREHTTRNKNGGRRQKWYLNPIYAPHFQIPVVHTKEPRYASAAEVAGWMRAANALDAAGPRPRHADVAQLRFEV